jgi:hypothetical protein
MRLEFASLTFFLYFKLQFQHQCICFICVCSIWCIRACWLDLSYLVSFFIYDGLATFHSISPFNWDPVCCEPKTPAMIPLHCYESYSLKPFWKVACFQLPWKWLGRTVMQVYRIRRPLILGRISFDFPNRFAQISMVRMV